MESEIKKTIAQIMDVLDLSSSDPKLKSIIKNYLWDLSDRLKEIQESKDVKIK
jgi:hypothetical protein